MAEVKQAVQSEVDWLLEYLLRSWSSVPEIIRNWGSWDNVEKEVFQLEWAISEGHLETLKAHVERGDATPEQVGQYMELVALIERYRQQLQQLFEDEAA